MWAVAPLSARNGLSRDSVELFVDRARMARADFELTAENEAAVLEICDRLDHVPLAIELAAARVRGMTPADIARRLDQRLRLLASTDRSHPAGIARSTPRSDGRTSCSTSRNSACSTGCRCSQGRSRSTPPKRWSAVTASTTGRSSTRSSRWSTSRSSSPTKQTTARATDCSRRCASSARPTSRQPGTTSTYRDRHADYYADYVLSRRPQLHGNGDYRGVRGSRARAREHPVSVAPRGRRPRVGPVRTPREFTVHGLVARSPRRGRVVGARAIATAGSRPQSAHRCARFRRDDHEHPQLGRRRRAQRTRPKTSGCPPPPPHHS